MDKKLSRLKRAKRTRAKIRELRAHRLTVYRTPRHIYVQLIAPEGDKVIASASSLDKELRKDLKKTSGGNVKAATLIGKAIAERAKKVGITRVAFDRSGYKYHGRIKALADAARENGLEF